MTALLAVLAVGLGFAAAWELGGEGRERLRLPLARALGRLSGGRARSLAEAALRLDVPARLERAGLVGRVSPGGVVAGKLAGTACGLLTAVSVSASLPDRLVPPAFALLGVSGFFAPDAMIERAARRRRTRLVAALPDALDLLATGAASGRGLSTLLGEIAGGTSGPLAVELAVTVADVESGVSVARAVEDLRRRVPGAEVGALAAALERSRRYGSPLADQLAEQASSLRTDGRRRVEERASRAAPKIQLVVALVLVPSVLLMILAAVLAHSGGLLRMV